MVVSWSPEPSKNKEDWLRNSNHIVTLDEDSEDDGLFPFVGYELLPHDMFNETTETELDSESDSDSSESREVTPVDDVVSEGSTKSVTPEEEVPRQDIVINLEEVREAMSNITLPESAIPPWAAQVPESQWTAFLLTRIRNMQNPNQTV